jgi:hypothetical protein
MDDDTKTRLGREGTRIIHQIEDALDNAIALHGQLVSFLPQARKDAGLSAVFGQGLFDQASELLSDLTQARRRVVEAHRSAEAVARYVGYVNMDGPGQPKGPAPDAITDPQMSVAPTLRVVEAREQAA